MNKTREIEIVTKFVVDEEELSSLLANASADVCGVQWWKPENQADYDEAKAELIAERKPDADDQICMEDVWARMLINGKRLCLLDPESHWHWSGHREGEMLWKAQVVAEGLEPVGGEWHFVDIEDVVKAIVAYGSSGYANDCGADIKKIVEDGDFYDADAVFQIAMYGDVIYG